ncbi:hypothetical protein F5X68DRAFT_224942 [Plectosphaerella plurivora]|uniref:Cyclohexanone monooxygenase n=1 Tax=Plectosphaerella plurivora TaxID=936078 RepID=A0A9P8V397_9PEZI|nr:hypothetical protein F5X68DRAFT_224942 [Plectosphaerella plurivora]
MGSIPQTQHVDALVVGAGVAGIYSTYQLTKSGLNVECIDTAGDVGGTWYWNTYPGAMSDTESYLYRYSWDAEDLRSYPWSRHYVYQPEILAYLKHVVKRHNLRQHMRFNTEMHTTTWDESANRWIVECSNGIVYIARYLWHDSIRLKGMTVGIIGNGSTGVQVMTAIASKVGKLVSFQRHPQYSASSTAFSVPEVTRKTIEATPEERQAAFQDAFSDITTNREANEEACNFIRHKINGIVKDPKKAKALKPVDLYARRPLCDTGYYQIFNRENVDIIDLRETLIESIEPEGIRTTEGSLHKLDVLIFATGFDAIDGSYLRINIRGRGGKTIKEHWSSGPTAYGAGAFANFPVVIESEINFIHDLILHGEKTGKSVEASEAAEESWNDVCNAAAEGSLFKTAASWVFGENVQGRKPSTKFYFGGLHQYRKWTQEQLESGLPGFVGEVPSASRP